MDNGKCGHKVHEVDFCVVGGGLAGMCAAIAAARHGLRVALMQDRPVLGGNCSSEIRMWIWGARRDNNRETGLVEEFLLENRYRNPQRNYALWDSVLYQSARYQRDIVLLLNCSCNNVEMANGRIQSVTGWQTTTQTWQTVRAPLFADCSGDSILAPLTGAEYRVGREGQSEFNESIAPAEADRKTMGMSCLIQARQTDKPSTYIPPTWANKYLTDDDLPYRKHDFSNCSWMWNNFWWIELGGEQDSIHDTEEIRDELLRVAFGVWDHIKNYGDHGADNWVLDWVGFLPGKRESRRYVGDHLITENDVRASGQFEDVVAYGGWPMDDHYPGGMNHRGRPSRIYITPSPWGIPYRALYSRNVDNLFFAGRNISATHVAIGSSRVMATCALIGQAVGVAASIAVKNNLLPRGVYQQRLAELQQKLQEDDCFLPGKPRPVSELSRQAELTASEGDPEPLRNGIDRPVGEVDNGWTGAPEGWVQYSFATRQPVREIRIVMDSDLNRADTNMLAWHPLEVEHVGTPKTIVRAFRVEVMDGDGAWTVIARQDNNYQRLVRIHVNVEARAIRFVPEQTWGAEKTHLFAFEVR
ncbi:MAG TPA: FAD-dependent oxidoreductase [Thermoguttaceae bacterium]|nr:FAD-dependent oxidoreductase [Thermoguttaceae bacterium]